MSDEPRIRQATAEEADRLREIGETGWETTYASFIEQPNREKYLASEFWSLERLRDVIRDEQSETLVAEVEGIAVGFITLEPIDAETAELTRLYVNPEFRGSGLGQDTLGGSARADPTPSRPRRAGQRFRRQLGRATILRKARLRADRRDDR